MDLSGETIKERLVALLGEMGYPGADEVARIEADHHRITLTIFDTDADGFRFIDPDTHEVATRVVWYPVDVPIRLVPTLVTA